MADCGYLGSAGDPRPRRRSNADDHKTLGARAGRLCTHTRGGAGRACIVRRSRPAAAASQQLSTARWTGSGLYPPLCSRATTIITAPRSWECGMWSSQAKPMNGGSYTLPEPFDNSVVVWHSDGTEIMNSSRPAQDGNFCMGVWQQTGKRQYFLNHIPWQGNDPMRKPTGRSSAPGANHLEPGRESLLG